MSTGIGIARSGVPLATPGMKRSSVMIRNTGAGGHRTAEAGDERRPAGQKAGQRAEGLAEIDVLAAGLRPQRGELGVGHRAHEREHAAGHPREQEPGRVRDRSRDGGERKRMPPPMTLATMMAAASKGPRRRSRTGGLVEVVCTRGFNHEVRCHSVSSLAVNRKFADLDPRARAVASEQIHLDVNELLVLQHVRAGLGAGIAARTSHDERTARRPARKAVGPDAPDSRSPQARSSVTRRKTALT